MMQTELIDRVRHLCVADDRLDAALMYGSFAQGVGDRYSDVEFWLFTTRDLDERAWIARVADPLAITVNEFGAHVAFFAGLIRGEFHFAPAAEIESLSSWPSLGAPIDDLIVLDRHGRLREVLGRLPVALIVPSRADEIEQICLRYANWLVLGLNVAARGEAIRAHDTLAHIRRHLLWMARLESGATRTWLTPSRRAEDDLPPAFLERFTFAPDPLEALAAAWHLGRDLWEKLAARHGFAVPTGLFAELENCLH